MKIRWRNWVILLWILTGIYLGSYIAKSNNGLYVPATTGSMGPKNWRWAPVGFTWEGKYNLQIAIYFPLWILDHWLWHRAELANEEGVPRLGRNYTAIRNDIIWTLWFSRSDRPEYGGD
jgi:hypothetical protein